MYQRDQLFKRYNDLLKNFDAELRCLRHEKFKMDIDLKNADLRYAADTSILNLLFILQIRIIFHQTSDPL